LYISHISNSSLSKPLKPKENTEGCGDSEARGLWSDVGSGSINLPAGHQLCDVLLTWASSTHDSRKDFIKVELVQMFVVNFQMREMEVFENENCLLNIYIKLILFYLYSAKSQQMSSQGPSKIQSRSSQLQSYSL